MSELLNALKRHGLLGCLDGTGVNSENYKKILNLELWDHSQPSGARFEDKIKWAIEFLEKYGYNISK
jgi:hypothetical protein